MDSYTVTYVLKNDMGGISSLIHNLIEYRGDKALPQEVIAEALHNKNNCDR